MQRDLISATERWPYVEITEAGHEALDAMPTTRVFDVVAAYEYDGGTYSWEGEAINHNDAERRAQRQSFEDNHGSLDGYAPMLNSASVVERTQRRSLIQQVIETLTADGHRDLADALSTELA
jgi:hypothetical protein